MHRRVGSSPTSSRCRFAFRLCTLVLVQGHTWSRSFRSSLAVRMTRIGLFPAGDLDPGSFDK